MCSRGHKGLTLLELIIAMAIGVVLVQLIVSIALVFQNTWQEQFTKNKVNANFIVVTERLMNQSAGLNNWNSISLQGIPYRDDIKIEPLSGANHRIAKITINKFIGKYNYIYQQYIKLGAY